MPIKTVTFAKNGHGLESLRIDTKTQTIYSISHAMFAIAGRHYRLVGKSGNRIAFRSGDGYREIVADIKSIK